VNWCASFAALRMVRSQPFASTSSVVACAQSSAKRPDRLARGVALHEVLVAVAVLGALERSFGCVLEVPTMGFVHRMVHRGHPAHCNARLRLRSRPLDRPDAQSIPKNRPHDQPCRAQDLLEERVRGRNASPHHDAVQHAMGSTRPTFEIGRRKKDCEAKHRSRYEREEQCSHSLSKPNGERCTVLDVFHHLRTFRIGAERVVRPLAPVPGGSSRGAPARRTRSARPRGFRSVARACGPFRRGVGDHAAHGRGRRHRGGGRRRRGRCVHLLVDAYAFTRRRLHRGRQGVGLPDHLAVRTVAREPTLLATAPLQVWPSSRTPFLSSINTFWDIPVVHSDCFTRIDSENTPPMRTRAPVRM